MCFPANLGFSAVSSHPLVFSGNSLETDENLTNIGPQISQALFKAHSTGKISLFDAIPSHSMPFIAVQRLKTSIVSRTKYILHRGICEFKMGSSGKERP